VRRSIGLFRDLRHPCTHFAYGCRAACVGTAARKKHVPHSHPPGAGKPPPALYLSGRRFCWCLVCPLNIPIDRRLSVLPLIGTTLRLRNFESWSVAIPAWIPPSTRDGPSSDARRAMGRSSQTATRSRLSRLVRLLAVRPVRQTEGFCGGRISGSS
jgi:hypothetical protein